jgi:hypothetical protein
VLSDLVIDSNLLVTGSAAIAAWVAALFSYKSYGISQKALALAEIEQNSKKTKITAYLADSFKVYSSDEKQTKYIFSISYANKSEASDSITDVFLKTYYVNSSNRISYLISPHELDAEKWLSGQALPAKFPINIQPRSSITNWFIFTVPSVAEKAKRINKYRIVATNNNGEKAMVESNILREIKHEKGS